MIDRSGAFVGLTVRRLEVHASLVRFLRPQIRDIGDLGFDAHNATGVDGLAHGSASVRRGGVYDVKMSRLVMGSAVAVSLVGAGLLSTPVSAQDECGVAVYGGDVWN